MIITFLAALSSGLMLWACYPPHSLGPVVWVALIPLLAVLWSPRPPARGRARWLDARTPTGAFAHGYLAGGVFFVLNLKWLHHVTAPGAVMLSLYLALYPAIWALCAATIGRPRHWTSRLEIIRATTVTAAVWTSLEWLRGQIMTGFGWNGLGTALATSHSGRHFRQGAEWLGVTGLSFFIVALPTLGIGLWFHARQNRRPGRSTLDFAPFLATTAAVTLAFYTAVTTIGSRRESSISTTLTLSPTLPVALIQPNVLQEIKNLPETFDAMASTLDRLSRQALATTPAPQLLAWPESALPAPYSDEGVQYVLRQLAPLGHFTHILGIDDQQLDAYYNSIAVFRGDPQQATLHHKVHLVPFGEYLPARGLFGRFDFIREQLPGDFQAGDSSEPLPFPLPPENETQARSTPGPHLSLIPLVCFEDTLGRVARRFVRDEPQLIVNVTNDAWFRDSEGADQHLANAIFRAIELRRPLIRTANTGVTAVIDPLGRVTHQLPRLQEGVLLASIPLPTTGGLTFYARHGDIFAQSLLGLVLLATLHAVWRARQHQRSPRPTP